MASKTVKRDLKALEEVESWDLETRVKVERPQRNRRVLVSVPFQKDEFNRVSRAATSCEMRLSVFIRSASLEKAESLEQSEIFAIKEEEQWQILAGDRIFTQRYTSGPPEYDLHIEVREAAN